MTTRLDRSTVLSAQRSRTGGGGDMGGSKGRGATAMKRLRGRQRQGRLCRSLQGAPHAAPGHGWPPRACAEQGPRSAMDPRRPRKLFTAVPHGRTAISAARRYHWPACNRPLCRRLGRLVGKRVVPASRRLRHLARHDVLELVLVDGLVLDERFGHRVQLVESGSRESRGRACSWLSITLRTSSSIACAVTSDTCLCCVTLRPRNTSPVSSE